MKVFGSFSTQPHSTLHFNLWAAISRLSLLPLGKRVVLVLRKNNEHQTQLRSQREFKFIASNFYQQMHDSHKFWRYIGMLTPYVFSAEA